jgi:ribonuclease P protein component
VNRLGLVASKKVGNSVKRSRAKRVIREAFRLAEPNLREKLKLQDLREEKPKTYDFVFVARGKTPYMKSTQVHELMEKLFDKI